ncbi:hypothetical protein H0H93_014266 [Arthromyces matolae]|nr:hypothetical protein H0H93_014266 [Arthromyces matolae]
MAVLLQYNEEDSMMLEDLIEATGIEREDMLSAISVLVKAKILVQGADEEVYDLNPNFKLPNGIRRINLLRPVKLKVSSKPDHEGPKPSDFFERRHYIRTVIRRVMKRHTTLTRNKIIHETNQLIVGPLWEKAQPHEVSAAIDLAINEDEMELVPGSTDTFKFIP